MRLVHRALDDLSEGMRSLFGGGESRPELIEELLGERQQRGTPPRRVRPRGHLRVVRRRAPRKSHLVRVK
jgi:hypothetical protein